jgi:hypothetical protein
MKMWDDFELTRPADIAYAASREDMTQFFKLLQRQSVPFDCDIIQQNLLIGSYAKIGCVEKGARVLGPGTYLASGSEDDLGHCFAVVVEGGDTEIKVMDNYDDTKAIPVEYGLLKNFLCLDSTKWLSRVVLNPGYKCRGGKRKSKSLKKQLKRNRS